MKALVHTPTRLVFKHVPIGLGFMMGLLIVSGVAAGAAAISMHETLAWTDDFIRIGVGLVFGTLFLGGLVVWKAVRVRRLVFDADADVLSFESRGLGQPQLSTWPLASLVRAEISTTYLSGSGHRHTTQLVFADGKTKKLGSMDPPTHARIAHNIAVISEWLAARSRVDPRPSPRS